MKPKVPWKVRLASFLVLYLLAMCSAVHAQVLTGSIIGTIADESKAFLPGVTVTISSTALPGGPLTVVTGERGEYRFVQLEPGTYLLRAELAGFGTYEEQDLRVVVGGTVERIITMAVGTVAENVTVSGESPMIDARRSEVATNLRQEVVEVIPTARYGFHEYVKWAPGVAPSDPGGQSGSASVLGSSTSENLYTWDGVNSMSPAGGGLWLGGMNNAVQEVETITLGGSAEYQIAQGAVFNAVLKSGTNQFKFDTSAYFYPDGLTSKPITIDCDCDLGETGFTVVDRRDYAVDAGGPMLRDKLWFYAGILNVKRLETNPGVDPRLAGDVYQTTLIGKVTWQATPRVRVQGSYTPKWRNLTPSPSISRPFETVSDSLGRSRTYATEVTATVSDDTVLTGRVTGWFDPNATNTPLSGDLTTPNRIDRATGIACCGVTQLPRTDFNRHSQSFKVHRYIRGAALTHDVRFGVQFEQADRMRFRTLIGGVNYRDRGGMPDEAIFRDPFVEGADYTGVGLWAENRMTFGDRLTVNIGVRWDRMRGNSPDVPAVNTRLEFTGETVQGLGEMITWTSIAPRTGFNFKLTNDGKTVMRGNYGRAYRPIFLDDYAAVHPGLSPTTLARWDPATGDYTTIVSVTDPRANIAVDPDSDPPFTDSYSIGVDRELRANLAVGATYVYKHGQKQVGWQDIGGVYGTRTEVLPDGRTLTVFPLLNSSSERLFLRTNGPGTFNRYHGVVLTLDKRLSRRWQASLSYTHGRAEGLTSTGQDPNDNINDDGRLSTDRPHMLTAMGMYDIPVIDLRVSANLMVASGQPYTPQALVQLPQGRRSINIERAGNYRLPTQELLYLQLEKTIFSVGGRRVMVGGQIWNVLQDTAHDDVVTQNFFSDNFGVPDQWVIPRRMHVWVRALF